MEEITKKRKKKEYFPWLEETKYSYENIDYVQGKTKSFSLKLKDLEASGFFSAMKSYIEKCETNHTINNTVINDWEFIFEDGEIIKKFRFKSLIYGVVIKLDVSKINYICNGFTHESPFYYINSYPFNISCVLNDKVKLKITPYSYSKLSETFIINFINLIRIYSVLWKR